MAGWLLHTHICFLSAIAGLPVSYKLGPCWDDVIVGTTEPSVDWWLSGSNKTITRACHGFDFRLEPRHDRLSHNELRCGDHVRAATVSQANVFYIAYAWNRSSCCRQGWGVNPDLGRSITNAWCARVIVLLEPLSHQSTDGSVVPT